MDIFINILVAILCLIIGYIFGSIPFSVVIGKLFFKQDPRELGSKNAGGTNAGRLWGKKIGFLVIVLDMIKTIIPMWLCWAILTYVPMRNGLPLCASTQVYYANPTSINPCIYDYTIQWPVYLLANLGVIIGHCWPIFAQFKGGKAASPFMGTLFGSSWGFGWGLGLLFYFQLLKKTKYVSLTIFIFGGIVLVSTWTWAILCLTHVIPSGWEWFLMYGPTINPSWHYALIITISYIILVFRHRENIQRLRMGTERKITWMK